MRLKPLRNFRASAEKPNAECKAQIMSDSVNGFRAITVPAGGRFVCKTAIGASKKEHIVAITGGEANKGGFPQS